MRTIIEIESKQKFEIDPQKSGENNMPCPSCASDHPSNAKRKCFSWNDQKRAGFCHRCDRHFVEFKELESKQPSYTRPKHIDQTKLSEGHLKEFHRRMISNEAINKAKVYSSEEWMPGPNKKSPVVCFPFYRDGELINVKYRGPNKCFKLTKGAEKIFFNIDHAKHSPTVIIVEGEIDALSYMTCGINFVISVPNGANKNLDYLDECIEFFDEKESVIIAVDNDQKGFELREELARRIGQEKCRIVEFGDCKDANEFLMRHGAPSLFKTLEDAREYPVSGVFQAKDFKDEIFYLWENGIQPGLKINLPSIDNLITWETQRLAIITGVPGHGKSEFMDFILSKLNFLYGWKAAYFSPENLPLAIHYRKIAEKIFGNKFDRDRMTLNEYHQLLDYIDKNFFFINPEDDFTVDTILAKARYLVKKHGIKVIVIDPYNRIDHQFDRQSETQYISQFLDKLANFNRRNDCLICLVAHPTKMPRMESGMISVPNLYNISGSANFYNKADYGITVYRKSTEDGLSNEIEVYVQKVKFKHLGKPGRIDLMYNYRNGRFESSDNVSGVNGWDNKNWLAPEELQQGTIISEEIKPNTSKDEIPF